MKRRNIAAFCASHSSIVLIASFRASTPSDNPSPVIETFNDAILVQCLAQISDQNY